MFEFITSLNIAISSFLKAKNITPNEVKDITKNNSSKVTIVLRNPSKVGYRIPSPNQK